MTDISPQVIAELREQGDLSAYIRSLTGRPPLSKPAEETELKPDQPSFHIPRRGAWPCGTAATGPTPKPCTDCQNTA
ncbi:hypothetical protein [Streptomyces sp. NBC_00932]|uniref:hypothetical protein n=1 Tax=Streptomyces sp. NBC_00932 TaxID=2903690 RepID=UPI00386B2968|nr:hypothetical protein OG221_27615 [Streptomyces sp. NBC_00932]